jgi:hypothetical protein
MNYTKKQQERICIAFHSKVEVMRTGAIQDLMEGLICARKEMETIERSALKRKMKKIESNLNQWRTV